jgi:hypothetical protein
METFFRGRCRIVRYAIANADTQTLLAWQKDPREAAKQVYRMAWRLGLATKGIGLLVLVLLALTLNPLAVGIGSTLVIIANLYVDSVWRCPYKASDAYQKWAEDAFPDVDLNRCFSVLDLELFVTLSQEGLIAHKEAKMLQESTAATSSEITPTRRL